jgi:hypothetical protein
MPNISKFSFNEVISNDNGKSSGSGFSGVIICIVSSVCFIAGVIDKMFISHSSDVMNSCIGFATLGAGLLGVRKWMQNKPAPKTDIADDSTDDDDDDEPVEKPVDKAADKVDKTRVTVDVTTDAKGSAQVDNPDA